jgi:hypothetical protein
LAGVHTALRNNLWLLGDEYELLSSNRTLRQLVEKVLNKKYRGARARERPDLLLAGLENRYLLVELKRPGHSIDRDDVAQSLKYRDELHEYLPEKNIEVMLVGGRADRGLKDDDYRGVRTATFTEVVLRARSRLSWLIENLPVEDETTDPSDPNAA